MTGGCACGAVHFRLDAPPTDAGWCHCRTCQLNSGSPAMAFATVPRLAYRYTAGEDRLRSFASSEHGRRAFCGECGTPLFMRDVRTPEMLDVSIATLDAPDAVAPGFRIFYASRVGWAPAGDDLPRFARGRADGRC